MRVGRSGPALLALLALAAASSCVGAPESTTEDAPLRLPLLLGFDSVADALQPSCGTLDCHGQPGRNLRLFGARGLRLDAHDTSAEGLTTVAEYEANYWSIAALEPEVLSDVLAAGGDDPERLILIRKGRGTTRHKGGTLMQPNDDLDQCLLDWLKGTISKDRCQQAARLTPKNAP
jgi:hypothetical protein